MKKRVLFLCTHNSARSQMAEGWLRHLYGDRYDVFSAGTDPSVVHPLAVRVMAEVDIDISRQEAKALDLYENEYFDDVITICDQARETCPYFPYAAEIFHQSFDDPSLTQGDEESRLHVFRKVRDEIGQWIKTTFAES